jgi:hypothetical protein
VESVKAKAPALLARPWPPFENKRRVARANHRARCGKTGLPDASGEQGNRRKSGRLEISDVLPDTATIFVPAEHGRSRGVGKT